MVNHLYVRIAKLRRVILAAKLARIEQDSQNLWVRPCRPLRHHKQARKNQKSAEKTAEEVERRRTHHQGDEEQLSFSAKNRERLVDRLMSRVDPAFSLHTSLKGLRPRKEPGEKIDRCYRHAHAEKDSGEHSLIPAFAEGEHQAAYYNCDEAEALGNRASESVLKLLHRVFPRASAGLQQDEREHCVHIAHP